MIVKRNENIPIHCVRIVVLMGPRYIVRRHPVHRDHFSTDTSLATVRFALYSRKMSDLMPELATKYLDFIFDVNNETRRQM